MSVLATYRTAILSLLDDPVLTRYTNNQVDNALRFALYEYSTWRPPIYSYNIDGAGTYRIIMPADFQPLRIIRAEFHDMAADPQLPVKIVSRFIDFQWEIETTERLIKVGESLDVIYMLKSHTIADLDSATATTIPDQDESMVQLGAAGFASISRANSQAEAKTISKDVARHLIEVGNKFLDDFRNRLIPPGKVYYAELPKPSIDIF